MIKTQHFIISSCRNLTFSVLFRGNRHSRAVNEILTFNYFSWCTVFCCCCSYGVRVHNFDLGEWTAHKTKNKVYLKKHTWRMYVLSVAQISGVLVRSGDGRNQARYTLNEQSTRSTACMDVFSVDMFHQSTAEISKLANTSTWLSRWFVIVKGKQRTNGQKKCMRLQKKHTRRTIDLLRTVAWKLCVYCISVLEP